jgi:alpha-D-xyloside xylohydrolase
LPYYTPINPLFPEVQDGLAITDDAGGLPTGDAIADFSNPKTVLWYQEKLRPLLQMGVGAIKVDFGEGAPENGRYHSGQSGRLEHNRYPMRYQEAAFSVTEAETGGSVIWARAAWAGCQRYPIHWGGDAESTDQGLASSLQGGLSLGLCGFSFWSHDAGGFTKRPDADLYLRWLGAGVLGSHLRTHGQPPREPWTYGDTAFTDTFRELVELRYTLLPYIWAQAARCAEQGQPLMRAMLLDSPDLPESWPIDDQFRLGEDLLVIPLLRPGQTERRAWLPPGGWVDWFSGTVIDASGWQTLPVGSVPVLLLARRGSTIPIVPVAQHSGAIDWSALSYRRFPDAAGQSTGWQRGPDEATATVIPPT